MGLIEEGRKQSIRLRKEIARASSGGQRTYVEGHTAKIPTRKSKDIDTGPKPNLLQ
jgi:hypothetical protein